mgnify:CR=1 FL=1
MYVLSLVLVWLCCGGSDPDIPIILSLKLYHKVKIKCGILYIDLGRKKHRPYSFGVDRAGVTIIFGSIIELTLNKRGI